MESSTTVMSRSIFSPSLPSHSRLSPSNLRSPSKSPLLSPLYLSNSVSLRSSSKSNQSSRFVVTRCSSEDQEDTPIEKKFAAFLTVLDINQIWKILPHRFPFLLVDRVIEYTPGVSTVAIKNVTINDNFFLGHFPERPIMRGVLMVECKIKS